LFLWPMIFVMTVIGIPVVIALIGLAIYAIAICVSSIVESFKMDDYDW